MPQGVRRLWQAPLGLHLAALATILVVLLLGVANSGDASISADEGAAIIQARQLARGDGWITPHPLPAADRAGRFFPLQFSERGSKGAAPFGKHPLYAVLLAGADRVLGTDGMTLLSIAGTVLAALFAALISRDLALAGRAQGSAGPRSVNAARAALWTVGLASPLLFDGSLVIAHTLGAAAFGAAGLLGLRLSQPRRAAPVHALGLFLALVLAVLLRTEAALAGVALALVLAFRGVVRRQLLAAIGAATALAAVILARVVEQAWVSAIVGPRSTTLDSIGGTKAYGFIDGRLHAFSTTVLSPGYGQLALANVLLLVAAIVCVVGPLLLSRRSAWSERSAPHAAGERSDEQVRAAAEETRQLANLLGLAGAGAAVLSVLVSGAGVVPGLLVAFPALTAGLSCLALTARAVFGRGAPAADEARFLMLVSALFAAAVVVTQYGQGGSFEWGGRYFAVGIPVVTPVALLGLYALGHRLPAPARESLLVALVVLSVAVGTTAVGALHDEYEHFRVVTSDIKSRTMRVDPGDGGLPLAVTTDPTVPRSMWATFDHSRWLLAAPDDLSQAIDGVARSGVKRFVVVSSVEHPKLGSHVVEESRAISSGYLFITVRAR